MLSLGLSSGVNLRRVHRDCSIVMGWGSCHHWGGGRAIIGGGMLVVIGCNSVFIETRAYERG